MTSGILSYYGVGYTTGHRAYGVRLAFPVLFVSMIPPALALLGGYTTLSHFSAHYILPTYYPTSTISSSLILLASVAALLTIHVFINPYVLETVISVSGVSILTQTRAPRP